MPRATVGYAGRGAAKSADDGVAPYAAQAPGCPAALGGKPLA
jgi:hypothetical protein